MASCTLLRTQWDGSAFMLMLAPCCWVNQFNAQTPEDSKSIAIFNILQVRASPCAEGSESNEKACNPPVSVLHCQELSTWRAHVLLALR